MSGLKGHQSGFTVQQHMWCDHTDWACLCMSYPEKDCIGFFLFFFFRFSFGTSCRLCWRGCVYYCWLLSCYIISIIIISIIRKTMITLHSYFLTRKSAVSELYVVDKSCHIGEQNKNSMNIVCEAQRWQVRDRSARYPTHPVRRLEGGSERQQCHFSLWTLILSIELLLREPNTHPQPTS